MSCSQSSECIDLSVYVCVCLCLCLRMKCGMSITYDHISLGLLLLVSMITDLCFKEYPSSSCQRKPWNPVSSETNLKLISGVGLV